MALSITGSLFVPRDIEDDDTTSYILLDISVNLGSFALATMRLETNQEELQRIKTLQPGDNVELCYSREMSSCIRVKRRSKDPSIAKISLWCSSNVKLFVPYDQLVAIVSSDVTIEK